MHLLALRSNPQIWASGFAKVAPDPAPNANAANSHSIRRRPLHSVSLDQRGMLGALPVVGIRLATAGDAGAWC
jgi:hypothetical protein